MSGPWRLFVCSLILQWTSATVDIRLPKAVIPEHYRIKMIPVLEESNFMIFGSVRIDFLVNEATDRVVLHGKNITITDLATVNLLQDPPQPAVHTGIKASSATYDEDRDFIIFQLDQKLKPKQKYQISANYRALLNSKLEGFYRSSYTERQSNTKKWLAVTQMEPTDARQAFPCFDEPAMKATFEIIIGRKESMTSLSNMPLRKTEPMHLHPGWVWDHFEKSVPMSTYLVACLVSDFQSRSGEDVTRSADPVWTGTVPNMTEVRIWSRPEAVEQTALAVNVTTRMLQFLEEYFKVPFPLPKVDLVAVPDFSAGAMENWGLVTFRETALLFNSEESVVHDKHHVLRVIAHELAHQWFGNLVTMQWWNDLWLNEGFASYVEELVLQDVAPEFDVLVGKVLNVQLVMVPDSLDSSHPISVDVQHPNQIGEIFDDISYKKGSAVIRMMHNFLGDETFRQGLANYLTTLKYQNAEQDDLWRFLSEQAHRDGSLSDNVDVKTIMDTWTLQKGFPLVTITRSYKDDSIIVRQERFLRKTINATDELDSAVVVESSAKATSKIQDSDYKWWIPVSLTDAQRPDFSAKNTRPKLWLSPDALSVQSKISADPESWILANVRVTGYYRVNYDSRNWKLLAQQLLLNHEVINAANRAQLIDDAFALATVGILPYSSPLQLVEYLRKEDHYVPWSSALRSLGTIKNMMLFTPHLGLWNSYMESLVGPVHSRIGFDVQRNDSPLTIQAKVSINGQACAAGVKSCIRRAQELFELWMKSTDPVTDVSIPPDMRSIVYCNAVRYGGHKEWDFAYQMALNVTTAQHRDVLLSSLGCSREPWILIRYLSFIMDENSGVRRQDGRRVVTAVAGNPVGRSFVFQYLKDNWNQLNQYFGSVKTPMKMLTSVTNNFNTPSEAAEVRSFLSARSSDLTTAASSVKKILSNVAANIYWMENYSQSVIEWVQNKQQR